MFSSGFSTARLFFPYVWEARRSIVRFFGTLALLGFEAVLAASIPFFGKQFVQSVDGPVEAGIFVALGLWGVLWLLEKCVRPIQDIVFFPVINGAIRDITFRVIQHVHAISFLDYQRYAIAEVLNSMSRISLSARYFFRVLVLGFFPLLIKLAILSFFLIRFPGYGVGVLFSFGVYAVLVGWGMQLYSRHREEAWRVTDQASIALHDSLSLAKVARFFPREEEAAVLAWLKKVEHVWWQTNWAMNLFQILVAVLMTFLLGGLSLLGIFLVARGDLTMGDFVLVEGQTIAFLLPLKLLSLEIRQIRESIVDIQKILDIFSIPKEKREKNFSHEGNSFVALSLENVSFHYPRKGPLFDALNLSFEEGEKILVSGASGEGKTTLLHLSAGLLSPHAGHVRLFGQDVHTLERESIRKTIHLVPQEPLLFTETLRYNLLYGVPSPAPDDIEEVMALTGLDAVAHRLPHGLESSVGPLGMGLSGGERQRVAFARALLLRPRILLLDETFHSISPEQEAKLLRYLIEVIPTFVFVSHRPLERAFFTTIWHLAKGKVERESVEEKGDKHYTIAHLGR